MKHDTDAPWAAPLKPGQHLHRESTRPAVKEDLLVPGCWVAYGAALVGLLAFMITTLIHIGTGWPLVNAFVVAVGIGMFAWLLIYGWMTFHLWGGLNFISTVEDVFNLDINQDGHIGPPPVERFEVWRKQQEPGGGYHSRVFQPPGRKADFAKVCIAALEDRSLTQGVWVGTDKPYSRGDWDTLVDKLIYEGWWEWINPERHQQGLRVTDDGRYEMVQWLRQYGAGQLSAGDMVIDQPTTLLE